MRRRGMTEKCIHHWMIDPPIEPTSKGVCKHCGEEREFENYPSAAMIAAMMELEEANQIKGGYHG